MKLNTLTDSEKLDLILQSFCPTEKKKASGKDKEAEEWGDMVRIKLLKKKKK